MTSIRTAQKNKPRPKHVYTNDDLSGLSGGISVVGERRSDSSSTDKGDIVITRQIGRSIASSDDTEAYWRSKVRAIRNQIADVDQQIDVVRQQISKSGPATFDPTTGLTQNVIVVHDRNAELQQLERRKQNLEKQLDDLADEGRRAGANPGWFR
jgi:chaperonin cofactor prefoldin